MLRHIEGYRARVVELTHPPGPVVPPHVHHRADEAFYVLAGHAQGTCADQSWHAQPGSFVWLPRGEPHAYSVDGHETLRSLAITLPAGCEQFVAEAAAATVGIEHLGAPPE